MVWAPQRENVDAPTVTVTLLMLVVCAQLSDGRPKTTIPIVKATKNVTTSCFMFVSLKILIQFSPLMSPAECVLQNFSSEIGPRGISAYNLEQSVTFNWATCVIPLFTRRRR